MCFSHSGKAYVGLKSDTCMYGTVCMGIYMDGCCRVCMPVYVYALSVCCMCVNTPGSE